MPPPTPGSATASRRPLAKGFCQSVDVTDAASGLRYALQITSDQIRHIAPGAPLSVQSAEAVLATAA